MTKNKIDPLRDPCWICERSKYDSLRAQAPCVPGKCPHDGNPKFGGYTVKESIATRGWLNANGAILAFVAALVLVLGVMLGAIQEEPEISLYLPTAVEENAQTFDGFCCSLSASQSEPSNYSQSIGKKTNSEISKLHFTTKQSRWPIYYFGIFGCVVWIVGIYVFGFNGSAGLMIVLFGTCILIFYASALLGRHVP
jgi:hypothetical protein